MGICELTSGEISLSGGDLATNCRNLLKVNPVSEKSSSNSVFPLKVWFLPE